MVLFLLFSVSGAVGLSFQGDDVGMVDEPVDGCGSDGGIAEGFTPPGEREVAGDDDGTGFIAGGDELEEEIGTISIKWDVAQLIDNDQLVASNVGEFAC